MNFHLGVAFCRTGFQPDQINFLCLSLSYLRCSVDFGFLSVSVPPWLVLVFVSRLCCGLCTHLRDPPRSRASLDGFSARWSSPVWIFPNATPVSRLLEFSTERETRIRDRHKNEPVR